MVTGGDHGCLSLSGSQLSLAGRGQLGFFFFTTRNAAPDMATAAALPTTNPITTPVMDFFTAGSGVDFNFR